MYHRVTLHPALAPHVEEILIQEPAIFSALTPPPHTVLPTPLPVLGFQYRGRLAVCKEQQRPELLSEGGITGLLDTARTFQADAATRTILVRLKPWGGYRLFTGSMQELAATHVGLSSILPAPQIQSLLDQLSDAGTVTQLSRLIHAFLIARLENSWLSPHPAILQAATTLRQTHGTHSVEAIANDLGISRRQLERLFLSQVGVSPKRFSSLARFDWAIRQLQNSQASGEYASLAYEAGYADQAHFIRSFSALAGDSPGRFLRHQQTNRF